MIHFIIGIYKLCSYNLTSFWPYLPVCVMLIQRQQRRSCNHSPRLGSLLTIRDKRQILWALPGLLSQILWTGERRDMSPVWRCRCECTLFDTMLTDICLISCVVCVLLLFIFYSIVKWLDCISDVALMIYIYAFSRCFYPKRLSAFSLYIFFQYVCSLGIEPTTFCAANAKLCHWATGTRQVNWPHSLLENLASSFFFFLISLPSFCLSSQCLREFISPFL